MNSKEWNKFCEVFKLKVEVEVPKEVTRTDIIQTLVNEGDFIFKAGGNQITMINLKHMKGKGKVEKQLAELLWGQVEEYIKKQDVNVGKGEVKE